MGRLGFFVMGMLTGGAAVFVSLKYHVVRAEDGVHLIPKITSQFAETYVDVRGFELHDWGQHRELALAITRSDKAYLLQRGAATAIQNAVDDLFDGIMTPEAQPP